MKLAVNVGRPLGLAPLSVSPCAPLSPSQVAPAYERLELGIGDAVLQRAIQGATGRSAKDVRLVMVW